MDEPSDRDWMMISNDIRKVLNDLYVLIGVEPLPLLTEPCGKPTEEELDAWDRVLPGAKERIKEMARKQMEHRLAMERSTPNLSPLFNRARRAIKHLR